MPPSTRSSARQRADSFASGSEYHASNASADVDDHDMPEDDDDDEQKPPEEPKVFALSQRGRRIAKKSYKESGSEDELNVLDQKSDEDEQEESNDALDEDVGGYHLRKRNKPKLNGIVESDDEGLATVNSRYETRSRSKPHAATRSNGNGNARTSRRSKSSRSRPNRGTSSRKNLRQKGEGVQAEQDDVYVDEPDTSSDSADASLEVVETTPEPEHEAIDDADADADGEADHGPGQDGRKYALRQRAKINYAIPPPLEEMRPPPPKPRSFGRNNSRGGGSMRSKAPGWSASGAELSRWMGGDDSVRRMNFTSHVAH